ncbi:MAG TPA: hypothetical protein VHS53_02795, partial [Mucilaginibacter sp.]|nr:hypothetical protein [Mucilaginibacter sp.]
MKKIVLLIAAIVFAAVLANAQDGWVTHRADNRISIKFPTEPSEKVPGSFIAVSKDSSVAYVLTVVDFLQVANIDSVALAPVKTTPEFAAQLKASVQQGLKNVNLSDFAI